MASRYEEKKSFSDVVAHSTSAAQADVVALRLEVDDLCPLPASVKELEFNSTPETQGGGESTRDPPPTGTKVECTNPKCIPPSQIGRDII